MGWQKISNDAGADKHEMSRIDRPHAPVAGTESIVTVIPCRRDTLVRIPPLRNLQHNVQRQHQQKVQQ